MKILILSLFFIIMGVKSAYSSEFEWYINSDWLLKSSDDIKLTGDKLSKQQVALSNWYKVKLPATVFSGLRQNGKYPDIYRGDNIVRVNTDLFKKSWWYVKKFSLEEYNKDEFYALEFEGINYKANIWLNGKLIASADTTEGPFRMFTFDITDIVSVKNTIAIEVMPAGDSDLTIGFVDWNPNAPDNNMGLWRGVKLKKSGKVSIEDVAITSTLDKINYSYADLCLKVDIKNHSSNSTSGVFKAQIDKKINVDIPYQLQPHETKRLLLNKNSYPQLHIINPRVWWPVNMGSPELYAGTFSVTTDGKLSHKKDEKFGIRQIEDYTFLIKDELHRGYMINGKKFLLKGGGWVDDIFLSDNDDKVRAQVAYAKHMNLNTIRLEGFWGNSKALYDACQENGILLMIGLSCQWEWTMYCGRKETDYMCVETDYDINMVKKSFQDQVRWLLNNPSVFLWVYGSDKLPSPQLEVQLNKAIRAYDTDRLILTSCKSRSHASNTDQISKISGSPGVKMLGPYEYVSPVYWYRDNKQGGAYGFNTETGPGAQIPTIESLRKMLYPKDVPLINKKEWQYHCGRNEFKNLDLFLNIYEKRYWKDTNVENFAFNVQMSNYETMRAMFEAFVLQRNERSTGVIQWMLNSAWPEMFWQLYDWYLNPTGAFYGAKVGCKPLNLIYDYGNKNIYLSNELNTDSVVNAQIQLYDIQSNLISENKIKVKSTSGSIDIMQSLKEFNSPSETYFLSLKLTDDKSHEIANNFYWLSKKEDELDFPHSTWYYTPQTSYASFSELKKMPQVNIHSKLTSENKDEETIATVTLSNPTNKISFFTEMRIVDKLTGESILPVIWSDNYVSLLPNEIKTYQAKFKKTKKIELQIKGFNQSR